MLKITLLVENSGGLKVKTTKKEGKQGAKFQQKLMCPEFNQINGKLKVDDRHVENYLACRK